MADKYDVTAEESINRANERVKASTVSVFRKTTSGYKGYIPVQHGGQNRKSEVTHRPPAEVTADEAEVFNKNFKEEKYTNPHYLFM